MPRSASPNATPSTAEKPAMRPLLAPSTARYAIFGPGVISMMRDVRTKAIRGD
jgi:hypothetical protein